MRNTKQSNVASLVIGIVGCWWSSKKKSLNFWGSNSIKLEWTFLEITKSVSQLSSLIWHLNSKPNIFRGRQKSMTSIASLNLSIVNWHWLEYFKMGPKLAWNLNVIFVFKIKKEGIIWNKFWLLIQQWIIWTRCITTIEKMFLIALLRTPRYILKSYMRNGNDLYNWYVLNWNLCSKISEFRWEFIVYSMQRMS